MRQLTVRMQLSFAFAALTALVLCVSGLALYDLRQLNASFSFIVHEASVQEQLAVGARAAAYRRALSVRNLVLLEEPAEREKERGALQKADADVKQALEGLAAALDRDPRPDPRDRQMLAVIRQVEPR